MTALFEVYTEILVVIYLSLHFVSTFKPPLSWLIAQLETLLLKVCSYCLDIFLIYKEVYVCSCYTCIFAHISVKKLSLSAQLQLQLV